MAEEIRIKIKDIPILIALISIIPFIILEWAFDKIINITLFKFGKVKK